MTRFRKEKAVNKAGFSRWVQPVPDNYLLACCDCGLVHTIQFRIGKNGRIQFRAARNEQETRDLRADGSAMNTDTHSVVVAKHPEESTQ